MRDLRDLPIGEMILGMLAAAIAATFAGVFITVGGDNGEAGAQPPVVQTPLPGTDLTIEMGDNFFTYQGQRNPTVTVQAGRQLTVGLPNIGNSVHNMRVAGPDNRYDNADDAVSIPESIRAKQTGTIVFNLGAGSYNFRCDFHPTEMTGALTVQ